jgi:hypothetical protein
VSYYSGTVAATVTLGVSHNGVSELDELRKEIRVTMCQLEMCFPPLFFDMMEHYMIHVVDQIFVLDPS